MLYELNCYSIGLGGCVTHGRYQFSGYDTARAFLRLIGGYAATIRPVECQR